MYNSIKKTFPWRNTLLTIYFLAITLIVSGYFFYFYWQEHHSASMEVSITPTPVAPPPKLSENVPKTSDGLPSSPILPATSPADNRVLLPTTERFAIDAEQLAQLKMGREVLNDFAERFFQYETLLFNVSFFQFFKELVSDYIENRAISIRNMKEFNPSFDKLHEEFVSWVISQEDQKLEALAHFVGFYLIEPLYQLPLTLVASSLSSEIETIDFQLPVLVSDVPTPPIRDLNGELKMNTKVYLDQYTSAQQFLYRRGPQFSAKVLVFLQSYLAYEND